MLTDRVDTELLDAAGPQLRIVANYAVGLDNVDLDECERRGIDGRQHARRAHGRDGGDDARDHAGAHATCRRGRSVFRRREEWQWAPTFMLGRGLAGLMLGIVGFGRIGQAVGQLGRAHGMHVVHAGEFPLDDLVEMADILTLHVPLNDETHHLMGSTVSWGS